MKRSDARWREMMGDEEKWQGTKGVIGDEEMRDEKKWWEVNRREKDIMGNEKM